MGLQHGRERVITIGDYGLYPRYYRPQGRCLAATSKSGRVLTTPKLLNFMRTKSLFDRRDSTRTGPKSSYKTLKTGPKPVNGPQWVGHGTLRPLSRLYFMFQSIDNDGKWLFTKFMTSSRPAIAQWLNLRAIFCFTRNLYGHIIIKSQTQASVVSRKYLDSPYTENIMGGHKILWLSLCVLTCI